MSGEGVQHLGQQTLHLAAFAELAVDRTPPDLPVQLAEAGPQIRLLNRSAEPATEAEIAANPRAASVRLRAAQRIRSAA